MNELRELAVAWIEAKQAEAEAVEYRRRLEDHMASLLQLPPDLDGTTGTEAPGGYKIKVTGRINRSVNSELVQELAAEHGLSDHLPHLFRWKPELNMTAWKAADDSITRPLAEAITAKPGRPSFAITKEDQS